MYMMGSTHLEPPQESINRLVRGIKALDNDKFVTKLLFVRNISIRILLFSYIIYSFVYENQLLLSGIIVFGVLYFTTQAYVFSKFILTANYGFSDWKFLFQNQSRFSKLFIIGGLLLIPILSAELMIISENVIETAVTIPLLLAFITNTLTDVIVSPYIKHKMKNRQQKSKEQRVLSELSSEVKESEYEELAKSILTDRSEDKDESADESQFNMDGFLDDGEQSQSMVDRHRQEQLRERAIQKIEQVRSASKNPNSIQYALTPEEIDALESEEIKALFNSEDAPSTAPSHMYAWEMEEKRK